jgi:hypothetical protein
VWAGFLGERASVASWPLTGRYGVRARLRQQRRRIAAAYDGRKRRRRPGQKRPRTALNCEGRVEDRVSTTLQRRQPCGVRAMSKSILKLDVFDAVFGLAKEERCCRIRRVRELHGADDSPSIVYDCG